MFSPIDQYRKEYTQLLDREHKAEIYLFDPSRTHEEVGKWKPEYARILKRLEELLSEIKHYTPENIHHGWPELVNESKEEPRIIPKPVELTKQKLF